MDIKASKRIPPGKPRYHRLTHEQRIIIQALRKEGNSLTEIAKKINCNKGTVSRELSRNKSKKGYRHKKAQSKANFRARVKASQRRRFEEKMWDFAVEKLRAGWTFEQISGRAKRDGKKMVSKETLYKEYYRRQELVRKGASDESLPPLPKRKKIRKTRDRDAKKYRNAGRGRIPDRVDIDERPKVVENRARVGHWEADLVNGKHGTGNLITIAERKTRYTLVAYASTKETDSIIASIIGMLGNIPRDMLKTCTFDNGKEFASFKQLEQAHGLKVYFAKPYHSWERGTSENRNGIVRKVLPKGSSFENISEEEMRSIDHMLNDRPMKCLDWRTPREAFLALMKHYLHVA